MARDTKSTFPRLIDPAFCAGMVLTGAFYAFVLQPSMRDTMLRHYTTEHPVEYVVVALFCWGLVDLVLKLIGFPKEMLALRLEWIPPCEGREPAANANVYLDEIRARPRWQQETRVGRRMAAALGYVVERGTAEDFHEHLQYLADQDEDATHANYTLLRFVAGIAPVLGFLGTVIHFGTALSGISFEDMDERMPIIVGEMGSAFNTTTVALGTAMTMMFALFICERRERGIVRLVNRLVDRELANRFEVKQAAVLPFLSAVQSANEEALRAIAGTLERQVELWSGAIDGLFARFEDRQQRETQAWHTALTTLDERHAAYDAARDEGFMRLQRWLEESQEKHVSRTHKQLEWAVALRDDFAGFVKTLDTIARGEGALAELQGVLTNNLRVLHETRQIDEALHGLTAAIHLLTSRHRLVSPHEAAA